MSVHFRLFSTSGCHLCEQAEAMIKAVLPPHAFTLEVVEISESDNLMTVYGVRIPVLRRDELDAEIGWPFTAEDVVRFASDR